MGKRTGVVRAGAAFFGMWWLGGFHLRGGVRWDKVCWGKSGKKSGVLEVIWVEELLAEVSYLGWVSVS